MEPAFFLIAILGCGDDGAACREARTLPARYATAAQCRAALSGRLAENTDLAFPVLGADCRTPGRHVAAVKPRSRS